MESARANANTSNAPLHRTCTHNPNPITLPGESRSQSSPAGSDSANLGRNCTSPIHPKAIALCDISYTRHPIATD
jgi:hypothetical protein